MKRHALPITALALAGALTITTAPSATAQSSVGAQVDGSSVNTAIENLTNPILDPIAEGLSSSAAAGAEEAETVVVPLPAWAAGAEAGQFQGKTWFYMADGLTVSTDAEAAKGNPKGDAATEMSLLDFAAALGRAVPATQVPAARTWHVARITGAEAKAALPDFKPGELAGEFEGKQWFYATDGFSVVSDKELVANPTAGEFRSIWAFAQDNGKRLPENLIQRSLGDIESGTVEIATTNLSEGVDATAGSSTQPAFDVAKPALPQWIIGDLAGNLEGKNWFYTRDFNYVVSDKNLVDAEVQQGDASWMTIVEFANRMNLSLPVNLRGGSFNFLSEPVAPAAAVQVPAVGSSNSDLATAALVALPAIAIIGGAAWYLNQDGRTYVPIMARVTEEPTPEERAASEKLIAENQAELKAQAEGAAPVVPAAEESRGIAAETGSNAIGKGLIALLLSSIVGAAVFLLGRRRLI